MLQEFTLQQVFLTKNLMLLNNFFQHLLFKKKLHICSFFFVLWSGYLIKKICNFAEEN